jgi:hypothetical protein
MNSEKEESKMDATCLNGKLIRLSQDDQLSITGGNKISAIIDGICVVYGTYAVLGLIIPGVNAVGAGSVGAFCAGYKLASWLL